MCELRKPLRIYILLTALAAMAGAGLCGTLPWQNWPKANALLALALTALIAASHSFVLVLSPKIKVSVETTFIFCALLLLHPSQAIAATMLGIGLAETIRRDPWFQTTFNASLAGLEMMAAIAVLHLFGLTAAAVDFGRWPDLCVLLVAALTMHATNSLGVAVAAGLQVRQSPLTIWMESWSDDILEHLALFLLAGLTVLAARQATWTILISIVPVAIVYVALRNGHHLRVQTREAVESMADVIDQRDPYTMGHSQRVSEYAEQLALALGLDWNHVLQIRAAARVHDLGKIGLDGSILGKNGPLTDKEWAQMRQHPVVAVSILERFPDFKAGVAYVRHHHERFDGTGYPSGLSGMAIPVGARIIAVVDAYDAMSSNRPYRRALSQNAIVAELRKGAGVQWDPAFVHAWIEVLEKDRRPVATPAQQPAG